MHNCRRPITYSFDSEYLERLRRGDDDTGRHFAQHFTRFLTWRLGPCYRDLDPEDLMQETLGRVLDSVRRGLVREPARLESFVNAVCNHVLRETLRSRKKYTFADADPEKLVSGITPERIYRKTEAVHRVRTAMKSLPTRDREVLSIMLSADNDAHEISVRLQVSRTYARVLLHRAISRLRVALC